MLVIGFDRIEFASQTDVGVRRSHNQDAHASHLASDDSQWQERGHVFLVADGMGAHAVGELASELAVGIIPHTYQKHASQVGVPALRKAFIEANATIHAKGQQNPEFVGMGTTTTALVLRPEGAWIGHVGDSRAYRVRDGQIEQMSFDHSLLWEMARRQGIEPEALQGIPSNVIIRSLGPEPLVQVDIEGPHELETGDIFLLCSDGLSGQVSDAEMGAVASCLPPAEACRFLVDLANLRGGPDNITVLIVRIIDGADVPVKPAQPRKLYRIIPWPFLTLGLGLIFAAAVALLTINGYRMLGLALFPFAALFVLTGFLGLFIFSNQEKKRRAAIPLNGKPRFYRRSPCKVEPSLVQRIHKVLTGIEKHLKEKNWEVNWDQYLLMVGRGDESSQRGDQAEAFRQYCRAMSLLADSVQRYRARGDTL
jgi:PPM family protein phosphatase